MMTVTLTTGLKVGDVFYKEVTFRKLTGGDILDASVEAERPMATPAGWLILSSPSAMGAALLRRQIASIGDHQGPLSLTELRKFTDTDLETLQTAVQTLDAAQANAEALAARGRGDGVGVPD
ncbi:MAG: phage tail assembly protein [Rhodospirillum sp.]|nr:phage tail assembly protein [Rhodospirillum sp.]MCF8500180.1 phage tail assembly protein [Rhodospirillum sp.]